MNSPLVAVGGGKGRGEGGLGPLYWANFYTRFPASIPPCPTLFREISAKPFVSQLVVIELVITKPNEMFHRRLLLQHLYISVPDTLVVSRNFKWLLEVSGMCYM